MRISVVLPAHNEGGNIGPLVREIFASLPMSRLGEVIVVDDASSDGTAEEVRTLLGSHGRLRYLRHAFRAGQSAALRSGVAAAVFPVIAAMDGDGQNDPADIPKLLALLGAPGGSGPALVGGVRLKRSATVGKRVASRVANRVRDRLLQDGCPDTGCGIKVFWRDAFLRLPFFTTMHRYLPALFLSYGLGVEYAPVADRPRIAGRSKYNNLSRALVGAYDLIGVAWLRRRTLVPPVVEETGAEEHALARESAPGRVHRAWAARAGS